MKVLREASDAAASKSKTQTVISLSVLALLCIIALGVLYSQSHFNPGVKAFMEIARSAPPESRNESAKKSEEGTKTEMASAKPLFALPEGFVLLSPPELFDRGTLSDKIDGKAELYLPAGFKSLRAQRFKRAENPEKWFEIFIYDMGNTQNAFAVFSAQRRDDPRYLTFAEFAYMTENALFRIHGPYYVETIAASTGDNTPEHLMALAEAFNRSTPVEKSTIDEFSLFPAEGLKPRSFGIISANAFGYEALDHVFTGEYVLAGGVSVTAFISPRESVDAAREKAKGFHRFFTLLGGEDLRTDLAGGTGRLVNFFDTYEAFFTKGNIMAGVHEAPDRESAETLAGRLYDRLSDDTPK